MTVATAELDSLVKREHPTPHAVLGAHPAAGGIAIRTLRPAAVGVTAELDDGTTVALEQIHPGGVFEGTVDGAEFPLHYRLRVDYGAEGGSFTLADPYAFTPTVGELDLHLIGEGRHEDIYEKLGAHVVEHDGVTGTSFAVWAPAARSVSLVGDFNSWDGRLNPMRSLGSSGIWELFMPDVGPGAHYKFEILTQEHAILLKADPYAQETEHPPLTASVVSQTTYEWSAADAQWLKAARRPGAARPADVDLRGPSRLLAAQLARGQPASELPRAGRRARRLRARHGVHPHRADAGDGPPVQRLVGLPGDRLLRPHTAVRLPRRAALVRRPAALEGGRGDPGLGARPLPPR